MIWYTNTTLVKGNFSLTNSTLILNLLKNQTFFSSNEHTLVSKVQVRVNYKFILMHSVLYTVLNNF